MVSGFLKLIGAAIGLALVATLIFLGPNLTSINTQPDQKGLWYKAGPLTSTHFDHCVDPGSRERWKAVADKTFTYPAGQRTFVYGDTPNADTTTIVALTKDNVELTTNGVVRFYLTDDCKLLQKFHEQIGLNKAAYMDGDGNLSDGWREVLNIYLKESLQRAVNEATQEFNWKELYNDVKVKADWEKKVSELLPRFVKQGMDGEYFENYSLTIQKPILPPKLQTALQETQTAIEDNNAQKQRNNTVETEAESIKRLVDILGPDGYNTYQALKNGQITVMPIPQGSGIMVAPTAPKVTPAE